MAMQLHEISNRDPTGDHAPPSSDSEVLEEFESERESFPEQLRKWVTKHQVKHNAIDDLLKILQENGHSDLPVTARTLLRTPRVVKTERRSGMDFIHLGLESGLLETLRNYPKEVCQSIKTLNVAINIDGIPLFKSSKKSLWPVLCMVTNLKPSKVFTVSLCFGESKPNTLEFLKEVIQEMKSLFNEGLNVPEDNKIYDVTLSSVICDAPAKAMIKSIQLYSGYYGCDKCTQRGKWMGRMTYQEVENLELRTDASFRTQSNSGHHHGETPFIELPIDMVKHFPIDYMHQVCLGVQRKLLLTWMRGKKNVRLSGAAISEVSNRLLSLGKFIPNIFARKPRGLDEIDRWKATEYRQFLLYSGKIVLKGILRKDIYQHFMVLSVAMAILISPRLIANHSQYAHELLVYFVSKSAELYGQEFLVYNVHALIHLTSDAKLHEGLDSCSAFPFENYLQHIKRLVRSSKNPVVQITNRLKESCDAQMENMFGDTKIYTKRPNNVYAVGNSSFCQVSEILNKKDEMGKNLLLCRVFKTESPLFQYPVDSRLVGAAISDIKNAHMKTLSRSSLTRRAILVEKEKGKHIFLTILHELWYVKLMFYYCSTTYIVYGLLMLDCS